MNAEPADQRRSDISRELNRVLELYATLQQHYRAHLELEKRVAAGAREQDQMALAGSEAHTAQLEAEIARCIERLRQYVDRL